MYICECELLIYSCGYWLIVVQIAAAAASIFVETQPHRTGNTINQDKSDYTVHIENEQKTREEYMRRKIKSKQFKQLYLIYTA